MSRHARWSLLKSTVGSGFSVLLSRDYRRAYDRRVNPRHRRLIIPAALVALLLIVIVAALVK